MVEISQQKLKKLEEFDEMMRIKLRERVRKLKSHETALESLERKLLMKLAEMQKRENRMGKVYYQTNWKSWQRQKLKKKRKLLLSS
jgi:hypothetical protein